MHLYPIIGQWFLNFLPNQAGCLILVKDSRTTNSVKPSASWDFTVALLGFVEHFMVHYG
jgi:hypothetical protein